MTDRLRRLLSPGSIVVVGGRVAEVALRQSRLLAYGGRCWAVHPTRGQLAGVRCLRSVAELPEVPDAAFVAVPAQETVAVVAELAALGVGGVVCHASGFAEDGPEGAGLQAELEAAAGEMPLIGPNCLGTVNYLTGAALWSDQQGGRRLGRGVAVLAQSGNLAESLTMQRRSLPLALLVTIGNGVTGVPELIETLVQDDRITAVGLHMEAMPDPAALAAAAESARRRGIPLVALKSGSSPLGSEVTLTHTSSLAGPDVLADALFDHVGIARVHDLESFVETLKLLHVHGPLPSREIASASCSGGEAAHVADLAALHGLELPAFPDEVAARLADVLEGRVAVRNPLDYHTFIWRDPDALRACFTEFLSSGATTHLLVLDLPRADRCDPSEFHQVLEAFVRATAGEGVRRCVVSTLPEGLTEERAEWLMERGVAPMQGLATCLQAVRAAADLGARTHGPAPVARLSRPLDGASRLATEHEAKARLSRAGVAVPRGLVAHHTEAADRVTDPTVDLTFPVVVKTAAAGLTHKSDVAGVRLGLATSQQVADAAADLSRLGEHVLVEEMVTDAVAELIVGVRRDPGFGTTLTVGSGGVLAELVGDSVTVLLPADAARLAGALAGLRSWRLVTGFRGRAGDADAVLAAVTAIAGCLEADSDLLELEVNPLLVTTYGAVAVDAVARFHATDRTSSDESAQEGVSA